MLKIDLNSFSVATSETARDINRRLVLNFIRAKQPISRADLARLSGLQRSTISVIIDQLVAEQWIIEGAFGHLPRGRKPRFLHLNEKRAGIIGINVRPTSTMIAVADMNAQFIAQETFATADNPDEFIETLNKRVLTLAQSHPQTHIEGVGISVPGRVNLRTQQIIFAPNLGWRDVDLKTPLESATGFSVEIENAANACALAEIWFEARAENARNLIVVTIAEGIGTGIIINGQLVRGDSGVAGEFGHVSINQRGALCKCGNHGCWELYASNQAAINEYLEATTSARAGSKRTSQFNESQRPTFEDILRLNEQGDAKAAEVIERMAHFLGVGLAMLITGIAPSTIVLIGEVTRAWQQINPIILNAISQHTPSGSLTTQIVPTDDKRQPRLRGAVALILQKHFGIPLQI